MVIEMTCADGSAGYIIKVILYALSNWQYKKRYRAQEEAEKAGAFNIAVI